MFYYRKDNIDGSFEIKSSQIELNQDNWFEIPKPNSAFATWDQAQEKWV